MESKEQTTESESEVAKEKVAEHASVDTELEVKAEVKVEDAQQSNIKATNTEQDGAVSGQLLPEQMHLALVGGEPVTALPEDLYIPPHALEIFLETFEGPLDLLLYLIKRKNLDILNIPVAEITRQYVEYVEMMKYLRLELAADYLVMAALLAEIKSRMLLPRPVDEEDEEDPRAELVRRLQEYERFKTAAEDLNELPRLHRDIFQATVESPDLKIIKPLPELQLKDLLLAFKEIIVRAEMYSHHSVQLEPLSVRERMSQLLSQLNAEKFTAFTDLFTYQEGRRGLVVTFLAMLELMKDSLIEIVQTNPYEPIHVKVVASCH